jgi:hypothetical protein
MTVRPGPHPFLSPRDAIRDAIETDGAWRLPLSRARKSPSEHPMCPSVTGKHLPSIADHRGPSLHTGFHEDAAAAPLPSELHPT